MKTSRARNSVSSALLCLLIGGAVLSQASPSHVQSGSIRPRTSPPPQSRSQSIGQPTGQSSVKGRVFYKDNAQPLKGTRVRIFTSSDVGLVETDNGTPLPAGLVIFLELISKGNRPGPPLPVRVKPDGTFNASNIQGGETYVTVVLQPDSNYFVKSIDVNGDDPQRTPLKIAESTDAGPFRVIISQGVGTVTGRVLSENGAQAASNIVVLLAPVESAKQRFRTAYLSTRTGPDGAFSISGNPGEYVVFARQRDDLPPIMSEEFVRSASARVPHVTLTAGAQKQIEVRAQ